MKNKKVCSWCHPQGEPTQDPETSHTVCDKHAKELIQGDPLKPARRSEFWIGILVVVFFAATIVWLIAM